MTVPVLCIRGAEGEIRWLPESEDIIDYLKELAG
jgi:glutathione S-transferase